MDPKILDLLREIDRNFATLSELVTSSFRLPTAEAHRYFRTQLAQPILDAAFFSHDQNAGKKDQV